MLVRIETIYNNNEIISLIDEIGNFVGDIDEIDFFMFLVEDVEPLIEYEHVYYTVKKLKLKNYIK